MTYLAVSDILVSCMIPVSAATMVTRHNKPDSHYFEVLCVAEEYLYIAATGISVLSYITLSIDRYSDFLQIFKLYITKFFFHTCTSSQELQSQDLSFVNRHDDGEMGFTHLRKENKSLGHVTVASSEEKK